MDGPLAQRSRPRPGRRAAHRSHGHHGGPSPRVHDARATAGRGIRLSRTVWRIGTDTPAFDADDLSGAGAKATGGRWNAAGAGVVYASQTRALACLETVVHLNAGGLPL